MPNHLGRYAVRAAALLCCASTLSAGEAQPDSSTIVVTAPRPAEPDRSPPPTEADPGAWLRQVPGFSAIRMGGAGLDPVLRGQSGSRLRVETDGACPQGACPNRMDPPMTYAPAGATELRVVVGGLSLRSPGAVAGTIQLDRTTSRFTRAEPVRASVQGRYDGNGQRGSAAVDAAVGVPDGFLRGSFLAARSGDYSDGQGRTVPSRSRLVKGGGTVGWTPSGNTRLEVAYDATAARDTAYPGAGMDSPSSDGQVGRVRFSQQGLGLLGRLALDLYATNVQHEMDNYSLRTQTGMAMRAPSTSETSGGRIVAESRPGQVAWAVGLDADDLQQEARRYSGATPASATTLQSVLWPDVRQTRIGGFVEGAWSVDRFTCTAALRLDQVESRANAARVDPPGAALSPDALYRMYYGESATARSETLVGALVRLDHRWSASTLTLAAARTQRAADPTERFLAANGSPASNRWIGDPSLTAETHYQVQARYEWRQAEQDHLGGEVWLDRVSDFIRRDRARAQTGILSNDQASIYRPAEVILAGAGIDTAWTIRPGLVAGGDAGWTWGEERGNHAALPQIPPLSGRVFLRWHATETLATSAIGRGALRQGRVDADPASGSALDAGPTPAWAVLDLAVTWRLSATGELAVGVDNLTDQNYAEHLNKPNAFDTTVQRVYEPGRSWWGSVNLRF